MSSLLNLAMAEQQATTTGKQASTRARTWSFENLRPQSLDFMPVFIDRHVVQCHRDIIIPVYGLPDTEAVDLAQRTRSELNTSPEYRRLWSLTLFIHKTLENHVQSNIQVVSAAASRSGYSPTPKF